LASGKKIEEAVLWATVGGALAVTKNGAQSSLPNKESFQQLLNQQTLDFLP
jgi:ribokinase